MIEKFVFDKLSVFLRWIYNDLETGPILDLDQFFPEHESLIDDFEAMSQEALAVFQSNPNVPRFHDIASSQVRISANDGKNWRMFMVRVYGRMVKSNSEQTPALTKFLKANPQVTTAGISFLDPGKHIPSHYGPFRGILRYHLCLHAPDADAEDGPWLKVDEEKIPYAEGGDLLWDDTYLHEVLNPGPNPRIALLLDVKRPARRFSHRVIYRIVMIGGWIYATINERKLRA